MPDQSTPKPPEQIKKVSDSSDNGTPTELPALPGPIQHPEYIEDTVIERTRHRVGDIVKKGIVVLAISGVGGLTGGVAAKHVSKKYFTDRLRPKPEMVEKLKRAVEESRPSTDKKEESGSDKPIKPKDFWSKSVSEVKSTYNKIKKSGEKMVNDSESIKKMIEEFNGMTSKMEALYKEYMDREKYLSSIDKLAFWGGFSGASLIILLTAVLLLTIFGSKADPIQKANIQILAGKLTEVIDSQNQTNAFLRATSNSDDERLMKGVADKMDSEGRIMTRNLQEATDTINKLAESTGTEGDKNPK